MAAQRVLLFGVGGRVYGCAIDAIREIIPFRRTTRLPGAPDFVCGLINLRGTIVTVMDLRRRLDPASPPRSAGSIVLVEHRSKVIGVGVDEVRDVQPIPPERIEAATSDQALDGIVRGLGHLEGDEVVVLLDMHKLVSQVLLS